MTECIFYCVDTHEGYAKGDYVYFNAVSGFKYLPHMDAVQVIRKCSRDIAEIDSAAKYPWIYRAAQVVQPSVREATYGKRV